jgi:hypothetical protein
LASLAAAALERCSWIKPRPTLRNTITAITIADRASESAQEMPASASSRKFSGFLSLRQSSTRIGVSCWRLIRFGPTRLRRRAASSAARPSVELFRSEKTSSIGALAVASSVLAASASAPFAGARARSPTLG